MTYRYTSHFAVLRRYRVFHAKKNKIRISDFFRLKPSPGKDRTNKKEIIQIGPYVPKEIGFKHSLLHHSAIV